MQAAPKAGIDRRQRGFHSELRTLNSALAKRTGFWRSLVEMLIVTNLFGLIPYGLSIFPGSPWAEMISFLIYPLIAYGAWRLEAGRGNWSARVLRLLAWCALYSGIGAVIGWLMLELLPYPKSLYGFRPEAFRFSLGEYVFNLLIITYTLILPTRMLIALWMAARRRLRWLLTFSYVLVGVIAIALLPVTYGLFIGAASLSATPVYMQPDVTAQRLVQALEPTVRAGVTPGELDPLFRDILAGRAQLPYVKDQTFNEVKQFNNLAGVRRLTLLSNDDIVLASAGTDRFAANAALPEVQRTSWRLTLDQARQGACVLARPVDGPLPEAAACAIRSDQGPPLAFVVVENIVDSRTQWGAAMGRIVGIVLVSASLSVTLALPVVAIVLLLALGIGMFIARRISQRLELLAQATGDIAAGQRGRRVEVDREDEIGRLSRDFNTMAARLEEREGALEAEAARAEAALEANKRLVANVSHELRTPLTTLRGYVEALAQTHGETLPAHDLHVIDNEIGRLTTLIEDLFTLARAEAQQLPLSIETVDADALVETLVATLSPLARRNRQIEIISALPSDMPIVLADHARLEQVFLNLVQNAMRYTPPGGIIAFEGSTDDQSVYITVADTGNGIANDDLPFVFERFYRGDESRARETGGAGLGLALARELVTAMAGEIGAESTPGRGSRFTVTLRRA